MSWRAFREPECEREPSPVALDIQPRPRELGGFKVARILPSRFRRRVGPFTFLDHMGSVRFESGQGADVPPHPHIGLATVTYLFDGALVHRDSLGTEQLIEPGDVNWMMAGRGIVHSERSPRSERARGGQLHGLQFWVALPTSAEDADPDFQHWGQADLPEIERGGVAVRLIAGTAFGETAPVKTLSPLFYLDATMPAGGRLTLPPEYEDRALYPVDAPVTANGTPCPSRSLAVLNSGCEVEIAAHDATRLMLFGGEPLSGERYMWWNFVASSRDRIDTAKRDWAARRFPRVPGDEDAYVPLP